WNMNVNAGFSEGNPQKLYLPLITDPVYRHESVNVQMQEENPSSLLHWMKNIIAMRKRLTAFGRGSIRFLNCSNPKIICFARTYESQQVIVVANLSQFSQSTVMDLTDFVHCHITEAFSQNRFRSVEENDYYVTLGPYGYFWFEVDTAEQNGKTEGGGELPLLKSELSWERIFSNYNLKRTIERKVLPFYVTKCRWYGGKAKTIGALRFDKIFPLKVLEETHYLCVVEVQYVQHLPEFYFIPLTFVLADQLMDRAEYTIQGIVSRAEIQDKVGYIIDSSYNKAFRDYLFTSMQRDTEIREGNATLAFRSGVFSRLETGGEVESKLLKADQSNTAIIYNDQYFLKFYRKIEPEINPELEIVRFLTEQTNFKNSPGYAGSIEMTDDAGGVYIL